MNFRVSMLVIGLLVSNVIGVEAQVIDTGTSGIMEETGQSAEIREQPLTTPASDQTLIIKSIVNRLHLNMYEAAAGDLSLCGDDTICLKYAKRIKSWICAAAACEGPDTSKRPVDCFEEFLNEYSKEVQDQINELICPLIKSPGAETRRAVLSHIPDSTKEGEDGMVRYGAYLLALNGSTVSCENYIKNYVGAYGPQWDSGWYRALSGCRILAQESTREQEEKDLYVWLGVMRKAGNLCSDIVNSELRNVCGTPGAKFFSPDDQ